jgi:hypothetical protein
VDIDYDEMRDLSKATGLSIDDLVAMEETVGECNDPDRDEEYKKAFEKFDADGSGDISPDELVQVLDMMGEDLDEQEVQEIIKEADTDGDGHIDYEEFVALMNARKRVLALAKTFTNDKTEEDGGDVMSQSHGSVNYSFMSTAPGDSVAALDLPELQMPRKQARAHMKQFDVFYSRPTPHVLRVGSQATQDQLRLELKIAEGALKALDMKVHEDVEWVHQNCPVTSLRAQIFAQKWGLEKLEHTMLRISQSTMMAAMKKWNEYLLFMRNKERAEHYLKCKGSRSVLTMIKSWMTKKYLTAWNAWFMHVEYERREEQAAAAVEIQRVGMGYNVRYRLYMVKINAKATIIQQLARGFLAKRRVARIRLAKQEEDAANMLQRAYRGYAGREMAKAIVEAIKQDNAAALIQRTWMGFKGRCMAALVKQQLLEMRAANIMQKQMRGRQGRFRAKQMRTERNEKRGACSIQARFRGQKDRERARIKKEQRQASLVIQANYRKRMERQKALEKKRVDAALRVQSAWRKKKGQFALHLKKQARKMRDEDEKNAATAIQKCYRGHVAYRKFVEDRRKKRSAVRIQSQHRRHFAAKRCKELQYRKKCQAAALRIQVNYRKHKNKFSHHLKMRALESREEDKRIAATRIQGRYRIKLARRNVDGIQMERHMALHRGEMTKGATKIQSLYRGKKGRNAAGQKTSAQIALEEMKLVQEEEAAVKLQCMYRAKLARKGLAKKRSHLRDAELERQRLEDEQEQEAAAIKLQGIWRMKKAKEAMGRRKEDFQNKLKNAANEEERKKLMEEHEREEAAISIQAAIKDRRARKEAKARVAERRKQIQDQKDAMDKIEQEEAALKMQTVMRGRTARKDVQEKGLLRKKKRLKELEYQKEKERKDQEELTEAAMKIQSITRGRTSRQNVSKKLDAVKSERKKHEKEREEMVLLEAVIKIQCKYRARQAGALFKDKKEAFKRRLEEMEKENASKEEIEKMKAEQELELASMKIQGVWRGREAQAKVKELKKKKEANKNKLANLKEENAAIKIQNCFRMWVSKSAFKRQLGIIRDGGTGIPKKEATWVEYWDDSAQGYYYFNEKTQEATWTRPDDYEDVSVPDTDFGTDYDTDGWDDDGWGDDGDWVQYNDDEGWPYWYNEQTGDFYYDEFADEGGDDWGSGGDDDWVEAWDENGASYWYNNTTGETYWDEDGGGDEWGGDEWGDDEWAGETW